MNPFKTLNNDVINYIFNYLDTYDIIKACYALNMNHPFVFKKILYDLNHKSGALHGCYSCHKMCMNVKFCNKNYTHTICYQCLKQCQFCNQYIGNCCPASNVRSGVSPSDYTQQFKAGCCQKLCCVDCIKTNWGMNCAPKCPDCYKLNM
jgi:hypothetical protein